MFDWEKAKVIEIKKPDLKTRFRNPKPEYEQKDLYDTILAYYCWLHIRNDLNERGILYTQTSYAFENWHSRLSAVFKEHNVIINGAYEEILKRWEWPTVYKPPTNMCEDTTFYYDLVKCKKFFMFFDIYKLLDYVYIYSDTYKVYDYDN
jgi:hypothetical protein